ASCCVQRWRCRMFKNDVREFMRQGIRLPTSRLTWVVDDEPFGAGADRECRKLGASNQELAHTCLVRPVRYEIPQREDRDSEMLRQRNTVESISDTKAQLFAD